MINPTLYRFALDVVASPMDMTRDILDDTAPYFYIFLIVVVVLIIVFIKMNKKK